MPMTDTYTRLPLQEIIIERDSRQRREIDTKGLLDSIARIGVLNPIIVKRVGGTYVLVAGERRLACCLALNLPDIPVRFADELSETDAQIIELEENMKRSDLPWGEIIKATKRVHELHVQRDPGWTLGETAEALSLAQGTLSMYMIVANAYDEPNVANAGSIRQAYNVYLRRMQRKNGDALQEILDTKEDGAGGGACANENESAGVNESDGASGNENAPTSAPTSALTPPPPPAPIINADFLTWIASYDGPKFNLIHCDFPYGVNLFATSGCTTQTRSPMGVAQEQIYDDTPEDFELLVETLALNIDKLMSFSSHIMFWYSPKTDTTRWVLERFKKLAPSIKWARFPLIWLKSDNIGIASAPAYEPRHIYETCLLGSRGNRQIVKLVGDAYASPTDRASHVSAKPEPMLKHFMRMLVDENTTVFDPTCGSGSALRAAEALGAKHVLGLEKDPTTAALALSALQASRAKKHVSKLF